MHGAAYAHPLLLDQLEVIIGSVEIRAKIKQETGLNASAGIYYDKFLAKLASDHRKPNGQYVITPEMGPTFVENLPVGKFHGIGPATSAKMNWLGLYTGLDMRNQSPEFMQTNFGKAGSYCYWISRGVDAREVRADRIRKSVGAENTCSSDLTEFDAMVAELAPLIDKVWRHCEDKGSQGRTVTPSSRSSRAGGPCRSRSRAVAISNAWRSPCSRTRYPSPSRSGFWGSRCRRCRGRTSRSRNSDFRSEERSGRRRGATLSDHSSAHIRRPPHGRFLYLRRSLNRVTKL